jgi:sterol 3beta-glucosyltransferase
MYIIFAVSFINKLLPFDPYHPRQLRLQLGPDSEGIVQATEYDTEESAQDWRRELSGVFQGY